MSETHDLEQTPAQAEPARRKLWVVALVGAVLLAAIGFGVYRLFIATDTASAGECVSVTGADDAAKVAVVDCGEKSATFKLASTRELTESGCPEGAYREVRDEKSLMCLMPNFVAGTCYQADDANLGFAVAPCDGAEAFKITKVIDGSSDPAPCPDGSGLGYPEPATVFCIDTSGKP